MDGQDYKLLAKKTADEIMQEVKGALAEEWASIDDQTKADMQNASTRMGELLFRKMTGEDVDAQIALLRSTILDWKVGGLFQSAVVAERAQKAFWRGVERVAETLSTFLFAVARGAIKGATGI